MRGLPRLPFLSHMPFPALARGEAWLLLEERGVPFVGAARGSSCWGDSALRSSWSKAVSQQPERSTEMNSLFSNYCYFGRLFWRLCNRSLLWWLWRGVAHSSLQRYVVLVRHSQPLSKYCFLLIFCSGGGTWSWDWADSENCSGRICMFIHPSLPHGIPGCPRQCR